MAVSLPGAGTRWRCAQCGNLTRFDVTRTTRVREFWHPDLAGRLRVDEREVLADVVESVRCRWCDAVNSVVLEAAPGAPEAQRSPP